MKWKTIAIGTALVAAVWSYFSWSVLFPQTKEAKAHHATKQATPKQNKAKARKPCCHKHKQKVKARKPCCHKHKQKVKARKPACHKHKAKARKPCCHKHKQKAKARKPCCHKTKQQAKAHTTTTPSTSKVGSRGRSSKSLSLYQLKSSWKSQLGKSIKLSSLRGHVVLLAMIYASCPHACPMTISDIQAIDRGLTPAQRKKVRIVLVTFDPKRDTASRLRDLVKKRKMDSRWLLLRGSDIQVLELAAVLGVKYRKINDVDYVHSNLISILDQQGVRRHQQVGLAQKPKRSVAVIQKLLSK